MQGYLKAPLRGKHNIESSQNRTGEACETLPALIRHPYSSAHTTIHDPIIQYLRFVMRVPTAVFSCALITEKGVSAKQVSVDHIKELAYGYLDLAR